MSAIAGVITINSDGGPYCHQDPDYILIETIDNTTVRNWSGSGTFNIEDVRADHQSAASQR